MRSVWVVIFLGVLLFSSVALGAKHTWVIGEGDVVWEDVEEGVYVIRWNVPGWLEGRRIGHAALEFGVDAAQWAASGVPFAVRLEALESFNSQSHSYSLASAGKGSGFGVSAASNHFSCDVTPLVRYWASEGGTGYLLVTTSGNSSAVPSLSTGAVAASAVARLTVFSVDR